MVTPEPSAGGMVEAESEVETSGGGVVNTDCWHISVRFGPHMLRGGMDPLSFLRYLTRWARSWHWKPFRMRRRR